MTTKSPLIRRVGSGYSASGNGFYLYDEDLQRVLARVAELTKSAPPGDPDDSRADAEALEADCVAAPAGRAASK